MCGRGTYDNYCSDDALGTFMTMSRIVQSNKSELATNISSSAEKMQFCQGNDTQTKSVVVDTLKDEVHQRMIISNGSKEHLTSLSF